MLKLFRVSLSREREKRETQNYFLRPSRVAASSRVYWKLSYRCHGDVRLRFAVEKFKVPSHLTNLKILSLGFPHHASTIILKQKEITKSIQCLTLLCCLSHSFQTMGTFRCFKVDLWLFKYWLWMLHSVQWHWDSDLKSLFWKIKYFYWEMWGKAEA